MSTPESIKNQLRALIAQANATTGKPDANLTAAQSSLISGYGQGDGGGQINKKIELITQGQSASNGVTSCSLTMPECTIGNTLILAYAVRGNENDPTLPSGWTKLGGGNNVSAVGSSDQKLYFATKKVTSTQEIITLTQTVTSRIYLVCSEYSNVGSAILYDSLASKGSANYTVQGKKFNSTDVMVYGVTSAYYGSGRGQTVSPSDLLKIQGDSEAERLACWFDDGSGAWEHTFVSNPGYTEANDALLECVRLFVQ